MSGLGGLPACLWRALVRGSLFLALAVSASAQSAAGSIESRVTEPDLRTTIKGRWERLALGRAVSGALRRLERPECQRLFQDFGDASGRTLQERLDTLGQTGTSFMGWMLFEDGRGERRCADTSVLAVTQPGSRAVWICAKQFLRSNERDPGLTEAILIHEELHALGLGEDPPSSETITKRVLARCGG